MPKSIVITPGEDANEKKRAARKKKADEKEAKGIEYALSKRMEELREFHDINVIQEASKKKGKARKEKETRKETEKETRKEVSVLKEFLLSDNELEDLTDIEWPEEYNYNEKEGEEDYEIIGHRINNDGKAEFYLRFTWENDKNDSGWYPASNAYKDYPHMTATFMFQMKLNTNKDWESLWTKVDKKLRTKCPRQQYINPGDVQCNYNHELIALNFSPETNPAYWGPNGDMYGKKCSQCKKDMVKDCKPSMNKPAYCCKGRTKYFCKTCFCNPCYKKLLLKDDQPKVCKGTRKSNRRA